MILEGIQPAINWYNSMRCLQDAFSAERTLDPLLVLYLSRLTMRTMRTRRTRRTVWEKQNKTFWCTRLPTKVRFFCEDVGLK
jgi:hypothetical protein